MAELALALGEGVFETILIRNGEPVLLEEHLARLLVSAQALGLPAPGATSLATRARRRAMRVTGTGRLRVALLRPAAGAPCTVIEAAPFAPRTAPLRLATAPGRYLPGRALAGFKTTNRMPYLAACAWAQRRGADDALLTTPRGYVTETSQANLFAVLAGIVTTPPLSLPLLPGVTRAALLALAHALRLPCQERPLHRRDLERAQELFVTSALSGVRPVVSLDGRELVPGPVTARLAAAYAGRHLRG